MNMFDKTEPVAANAQRVSKHVSEMTPNVANITFARWRQGDRLVL